MFFQTAVEDAKVDSDMEQAAQTEREEMAEKLHRSQTCRKNQTRREDGSKRIKIGI